MPIIHPPGTNLPIPHKSLPTQTKAPVANAPQSQAARPASPVPSTVTMAALFKTLGLPADKLSATILSFAKFFSLPLDPAMLASVRQQAARGLPGQGSNPANPAPRQPPTATQSAAAATLTQTMQAADNREALVLAALAAADKGVRLSEKALAEYVDAIDPDRNSEHDRGGNDGHNDTEGQQGREKQQDKNQPDEKTAPVDDVAADTVSLKKQITAQSPLLNTLNRLPGKDGRRWLVFPFSFSEGGAEYRASLRILLDESTAGKMSLDIVKTEPNAQHWLFEVNSGFEQVKVYVTPDRTVTEQQNLAGEVAQFLEVPEQRVSVQCGEFPFAPDCRNDELMPVDEAV